jgi:flavin reductase (DIM6/NTAB) family NADH-FMN oxidoreductase RutF
VSGIDFLIDLDFGGAQPARGSDSSGVAPDLFRELMGAVAAPVTVITTMAPDGLPRGTTVSAFCSVSLSPPLVAVMLDHRSDLLAAIKRTRRFGVNVLADRQSRQALQFASKGGDKFAGVGWQLVDDLPRLDEAAAWVACRVERTVRGGDHVIIVGRAIAGTVRPASPLVYHKGQFGTHAVATPSSR